jgi:redox-sensitive bicupin YhaK (pirin superfamily)
MVVGMTAGSGVVHGEMFPQIHDDKPNTLRLFQIWLNLPKKNKMAPPSYVMHWAEEIPKYITDDNLTTLTVWAGRERGLVGN